MDRISQLPEPILQRILCYLSPKHATRCCAVSKSWGHICSTRPKFELRESFFNGNQEAFFLFLDATLRRYRDQNISLPEFHLEISSNLASDFVLLLEIWIHVVLMGMGVKKFTLNFISKYWLSCDRLSLFHFDVAAIVFKAESLEELHLTGCDFSRINHTNKVMFNHLRKLFLARVCISDATLERMISSCPFIEHVVINRCDGLGTIKVNNAPKLKCFNLKGLSVSWGDLAIEIDVPSIECIRIRECLNWSHSASYLSFSHLKSLYLSDVHLSENSFHRFSVDFSCLEELTLKFCYGFVEFKLSSRSIKNLSLYLSPLSGASGLRRSVIDVPNIHSFELLCASPPSISFTTASSQWKSKIIVNTSLLPDIYELYKAALCHSVFSLHITTYVGVSLGNGAGSPVIVENLTMDATNCIFPLEDLLGYLFCFFRPRNIEHFWYANPEDDFEIEDNLFVKCLREFLVEDKHQGLEQVLVESSNEQGNEAECGLSDNRKQKILFRLKWRESRSFAQEIVQASLGRQGSSADL